MKKSSWFKLSAVLGLAVLFSSCLKNNDDYKPGVSSVSLINAYSGSPSVDFYIDGGKVTTQPLLYKQNTAYLGLYSGNRYVGISKGGDDKALMNAPGGFAPDKVYSLFIARKGAASGDSITAGLAEDNLTAPASGKAKIRFANFSAGSVQIDVYEEGAADSLFGKKSFRTVSAFKEVEPGNKIYELRQTGQAEVHISAPVTLEAGKIYTITAAGLWEGTPGTIDAPGLILTNHTAPAEAAFK